MRLHAAAESNDFASVKAMIEGGVDVNGLNWFGETPLSVG